MSGVGEVGLVLGIISSIIQIIDATKEVYEAVKDERGLPKTFKKSAAKLPLISKLLQDAERYIENPANESMKLAFTPTLEDCKTQATQLQELFGKIMPKEGGSIWNRYMKATQTIGKGGRVESLTGEILHSLQLLALKFPEVTTPRGKEQLAEAIEEVSVVEPSFASGFEEVSAFAQYGSGAQNNNPGTRSQNSGPGQRYISTNSIEKYQVTPSSTKSQPTFQNFPFPRNSDFVIREEILAELEKKLPLSSHQSAALWGLGGSGKTQIALEFAYRRFEKTSCSVFWIYADSFTSFLHDYKVIANLAGLKKELENEDLMNAVRTWIESQPNWLLVIDNADSLAYFNQGYASGSIRNQGNIFAYIPQGSSGTILWTTRDKKIVGGLVGVNEGVNVDSMQLGEAKALLASLSNCDITKEDPVAVEQLLERLDRLPLAISQVAAYIRNTSTSVAKYGQKLENEKRRWKLFEKSAPDRHRRPEVSNSFLQTWQISIDHIREENPYAYKILYTIAYFNNKDIWFDLIKAAARPRGDKEEREASLENDLSNGTKDDDNNHEEDEDKDNDEHGDEEDGDEEGDEEEDVDVEDDDEEDDVLDAVTRLEQFSFIRQPRSGNGMRSYDMHKLVQEALRYSINRGKTENEGFYFSKKALEIILQGFPYSNHNTWIQCETLLPHALIVSAWLEVSQEKASTSALLEKISYYLYDQGRSREAEPIDLKILKQRRELLGEKHPDTIKSMANLAATYYQQGRSKEAEEICIKVLQLRRELLGEKHPNTIQSIASLATTYHQQGRSKEAEEIYIKVLQLQRELLGDKHPDTIQSMASLASIYHQQDRSKEAEEIEIEVLQLRRELLGKKHPDTIQSMASLATTYHQQGRSKEAEEIYIKVLQLRRELLSEKHPDTIQSIANLASTYHQQGRSKEAEEICIKVLQLRRELLGEKHSNTIGSMASLASIYYQQGRPKEAEEIYIKVLQLRRELLGEKHLDTIKSMANLASTYHPQGRSKEAEEICIKVLQLRRELLGEKHPDTIQSMANLASTYYQQGRSKEAEEIEIEVLQLRMELLGEKHPNTIESMASLATTYYQQGQLDKAEEIDIEVLQLRRELLGEKHPDTIQSMASLASIYYQQGRSKEAEEIEIEVLQLRRELLGEKHPDTIKSMDRVATYHQ